VLPRNSERLAAMLREVGAPVELVRLESGHVLPLLGLSSRFAHLAPFVDRLDALLAAQRAAGREPASDACLRDLSGARGTRAGRRRPAHGPPSPGPGPARLRLVVRRRPR